MKQYLVDLKHDVPVSTQMGAICSDYSSGQYKSLLIHIFSGISDEEYLLQLVRELGECCGTDLIVGTMSAGEIRDGKVYVSDSAVPGCYVVRSSAYGYNIAECELLVK